MEEKAREVISQLDSGWHRLKHGNPIPSFYPQSGAEVVMVKGSSEIVGGLVITNYQIVVSDEGEVVGTYTVRAEESVEHIRDL